MLFFLFALCFLAIALWFVAQRSKRIEQEHASRLQRFVRDLQTERKENGKPVGLALSTGLVVVKRIKQTTDRKPY